MKLYITENTKRNDKTVAVDDTILVESMPSTAGSKMLDEFKPLFDAEVISRLYNTGFSIAGKSNVGEFGLDLLGETSNYGACLNADGTLAGAAASIVAYGDAEYALSVDLNGTPRRAAALQNVCFIKPTYGTVSRHGVIPCACSAEQIGVTAKTSAKASELLSIIAGHDKKDGTSLPQMKYDYTAADNAAGIRIGIPTEYIEKAEQVVSEKIYRFADVMKADGATVEEFSLSELSFVQAAWQILLCAETCNNLSRYDGVKFGYRGKSSKDIGELYTSSRTEAFGLNAKFAILYGSYVLSKGHYESCYDKALRIRRVLRNKLDEIFSRYDFIIAPACSKLAYSPADVGDSLEACYNESYFTALSNITGIPTVVCGGVQLMGDSFSENKLLTAASVYERTEVGK